MVLGLAAGLVRNTESVDSIVWYFNLCCCSDRRIYIYRYIKEKIVAEGPNALPVVFRIWILGLANNGFSNHGFTTSQMTECNLLKRRGSKQNPVVVESSSIPQLSWFVFSLFFYRPCHHDMGDESSSYLSAGLLFLSLNRRLIQTTFVCVQG